VGLGATDKGRGLRSRRNLVSGANAGGVPLPHSEGGGGRVARKKAKEEGLKQKGLSTKNSALQKFGAKLPSRHHSVDLFLGRKNGGPSYQLIFDFLRSIILERSAPYKFAAGGLLGGMPVFEKKGNMGTFSLTCWGQPHSDRSVKQ